LGLSLALNSAGYVFWSSRATFLLAQLAFRRLSRCAFHESSFEALFCFSCPSRRTARIKLANNSKNWNQ
jgi:hypothetical protein